MKLYEFTTELSRLGLSSFTLQDAARIIHKPSSYAKLFLGRAIKRGAIQRIQRGKFTASQNPFEMAEGFGVGYVSFLSALSYHGLTAQLPRTVQIASMKPKRGKTVGQTRFAFIRLAQSRFFGFKRYGNVTVAEPEKAVLDGLYLPQHLPLSEIAGALDYLDIQKLLAYAERFDSSIVAKRLGFLLERAGLDATALRKFVTPGYGLLNPALPPKGKRNRAWRLIENEVLE